MTGYGLVVVASERITSWDEDGRRLISFGEVSYIERRGTNHQAFVSEVIGDQVVRTSASANIDFGCGGTYQITIRIEHFQKARPIGAGLNIT